MKTNWTANRSPYYLTLASCQKGSGRLLYYVIFKKLSFKQIAEITQEKEVTIRGRMRYGLAQIRKSMTNDPAAIRDINGF